MKFSSVSCVVAALCLSLLSGCSRLTAENYNKLRIGMSYDNVANIIGNPSGCDDVMTVKRCTWRTGERSITIGFISNQAVWLNSENLR